MNKRTVTYFRKTHKLNQAELADLLGVASSTVSAYETGKIPIAGRVKSKLQRLIEEHGIDWGVEIPDEGQMRIKKTGFEQAKEQATVELKTIIQDSLEPSERPASEHYHSGRIDVWQFADENFELLERIGFHRINALKYIARFGKKKGYNHEDLDKAIVEIQKLKQLTAIEVDSE